MDQSPEITVDAEALRAAYRASGLWRHGMSYSSALANVAVFRALEAAARAAQRRRERDKQPRQMELII